jgi:hypothetical protein
VVRRRAPPTFLLYVCGCVRESSGREEKTETETDVGKRKRLVRLCGVRRRVWPSAQHW